MHVQRITCFRLHRFDKLAQIAASLDISLVWLFAGIELNPDGTIKEERRPAEYKNNK